MKQILSILTLLLLSATTGCVANDMSTAVLVRQVNGITVRAEFYADGIVRVVKYAGDKMPEKQSFSVIMRPGKVDVIKDGNSLSTKNMRVAIDPQSGCLSFSDAQGRLLLEESATALPETIGQTWTLEQEEDIFGLGQLRDEAMSMRGKEFEMWNHNTYISIPYFTSVKGYGLYWDQAGKGLFKSWDDQVMFSNQKADCVDYYFMYQDGTQDGVIACIRQLTGQATMFPLWTMGHWQCRERYKTSDELAEVLDRYRQLQIPLDGIVQDWQYWGCDSNWNAMRFQNPYYINKVGDPAWEKFLPDDLKKLPMTTPRLKSPQEMVDYVHNNHAHLMISIWASFGSWTEPYQKLKRIGGLLPFDTWPRNKGVLPYDPFNPKARDIYWNYLSHLYQMGFDAWWTDSTEPDHFDESDETDSYETFCGPWISVKNAFPLMTNKGIYEHQRVAEKQKMKKNKNYTGKRSVQMTRSGAFGLQHYGAFSWSGDINASWEEMKKQVPSGLNYTLCGIPFWNTDLGGFFYWDYNNDPKNPALQELQTRWMQWGTFMPLMRNHCSSPMVSEIYSFGQQGDWAYDAMVEAVKLRYRLLPYIYAMAGNVVQNSGTMMRPLVMDFPKDRKAVRLNDEYLFGPSLLVKPVTDPLYTWKDQGKHGHAIYPDVSKAAAPVSVYLPKGARWYDFFTNQLHDGGHTVLRPCPISEMPVYVKAGSIIAFGPDVQYSSEKAWDYLEIRIYPGADADFTLYEDEGDNYNYEKGQFTQIVFHWDDAGRQLTISDRKGSYKGMIGKRSFRIVLVDQEKDCINYEGREVTVKL